MDLLADSSIDPINALIVNGGIIGVFFVLALLGWIWLKPSIEREFAKSDLRAAQDKALIDTMLAVYHTEVLPTLADVDKRVVPLLESTSNLLKRVETLLDRQEREWDWRERRGRAEETDGRRRRNNESSSRSGLSQSPSSRDNPKS